MLRPFICLGLMFLVTASLASGQSYTSDSGRVEFDSSVPLHSFTGTSNELVGRIVLADSTVDFYVDLETLDTGIGKRDKDMRKTLKTGDFPFAEFFGKLTSPFDPSGGQQPARVSGRFSIRGVTKDIEVAGTLEPTADGLLLNAEWELNLNDYEIVPPKLLIMKVDPVQQLRISVTLLPESGT
ncbi:MAG: polyisoprenoid-binding protein YceI [Rhodothermales bacterium]|jgi:polyisoprenoid-binding protein YceI